jgi:hypothetical protein
MFNWRGIMWRGICFCFDYLWRPETTIKPLETLGFSVICFRFLGKELCQLRYIPRWRSFLEVDDLDPSPLLITLPLSNLSNSEPRVSIFWKL